MQMRVQEIMGVSKGDFTVLLGMAEKIKPNFYITLVGDPFVIQEVSLLLLLRLLCLNSILY